MAERIFDLAVAVALKHVAHRHGGLGAGAHRLRRHRIDILDIEVDGDRRTFQRLRSERAPFLSVV